MSKAISPSEVAAYKQKIFPDYVIDSFNELIAIKFNGKQATVYQKDVVELMLQKANEGLGEQSPEYLKKSDIYNKGYLEVEDIYRAEGWSVFYDKPGYNENYLAHFKFMK